MKVCAGTKNPSKISGIRKGFETFYARDIEILFTDVSSEVPPQPIGLKEIIKGARNRALEAFKKLRKCEFSVGVEAGIFRFGNAAMDIQAAVIFDRRGKESIGLSPSFPIPQVFSDLLLHREVRELEVLVDKYYGTENIGDKGGFIKLLTKETVTREDLTKYAVIMALVPWVNKDLYHY